MKKTVQIILLLFIWNTYSQNDTIHLTSNLRLKKYVVSDSIVFHKVSTNPATFKIIVAGMAIDSTYYDVDFSKSLCILNSNFYANYPQIDSLEIQYKTYPNLLTKTYFLYDKTKVFPNLSSNGIMAVGEEKKPLKGIPFEGLNTQGNLIRGITIGNNQDAVLNSTLDLKIEGKLSSQVSLNARINDTNIPIQDNGYSQALKDIDRVYIELMGPKWNITAGDIILKDSTSYFLNFTKKVQGISLDVKTKNIAIFNSGALVKGRYAYFQIKGEEANQGPYKLQGENGQLYIFIISGSETVYVNGALLSRGEEKDYTMDYNTGEITFNTTFPITSDMRITLEYQYSDRNYTRLVSHNVLKYYTDSFEIGASYYRESDLKNQTLEINLTDEQKLLLAAAGNNSSLIYTESALMSDFNSNKILYKKTTINGTDIFVYSNNPDDTLYEVGFTYFGNGLGNYKVSEYLAIGKIMEYVGENQGDYKAVIPLSAPSSKEIIALHSSFTPNEKTNLNIDFAYSKNDNNLFSNAGNSENKAPALKVDYLQTLWDKKWKATSSMQFDFLHKNFNNIEGMYQIEFHRDWNLQESQGNQSLFSGQINLENNERGNIYYQLETLNFKNNYSGSRNNLGADLQLNQWSINQWSSILRSNDSFFTTQFLRNETSIKYAQQKWWTQIKINFENNYIKNQNDQSLSLNSFKALQEKWLFGMGDSTKVFLKFGLFFTQNDSIKLNRLQRVNQSKTWFLQTQLVKKPNSNLQLFFNYRTIRYAFGENLNTLNNRVIYNQQLLNKLVSFQTDYQNSSGQISQLDYTYVETEPGQGFYTWIDYNNNGIKELDEFEIAQFLDQANYLRIVLPHISYLPTQESKISQNLVLNPSIWAQENGLKKILSHYYNQLTILAQTNKRRINNSYNFNPFDFANTGILSNQFNLRNELVFNRGKSHYTTTYIFGNTKQKSWQQIGAISQKLTIHQLLFQHSITKQWQMGWIADVSKNSTTNEAYLNRNYQLNEWHIKPNLTYFFDKTHWLKSSLEWAEKQNELQGEQLNIRKLSFNYSFTSVKETRFSVDFNLLQNHFEGNSNSAVGYQMLEGLKPGKNMTWNLLWSKKINSFLFLNLNYNGRANESSRTIHNGNVELRANF